MLYTSKSDFVRRSDVNCETSYYKMMNFVLQNDESKIFMLNTSKPHLIWWNTVIMGSKKQGSNHGSQSSQHILEPLSLSTMLNQ